MRSTTTHTEPMTHRDACHEETPVREVTVIRCPYTDNLQLAFCSWCEPALQATAEDIAREREAGRRALEEV